MQITTSELLRILRQLQADRGGFTGEDIADIARQLGIFPHGLAARVHRHLLHDSQFHGLNYLGKRRADVVLEDYDFVLRWLHDSPDGVLQNLVEELNLYREARGLPPLPRSSIYKLIGEYRGTGLAADDPRAYFHLREIPVGEDYDLPTARESLRSIFRLSGVTSWHGIVLSELQGRLAGALHWFQRLHPGADIDRWFLDVAPRLRSLSGFLATLHSDERPATQARLVFDQMVGFIVETTDFTLDQLRRSRDRLSQSYNALLTPELLALHREDHAALVELAGLLEVPTAEEWAQVVQLLREEDHAPIRARLRVRRRRVNDAARIFLGLRGVTRGFSDGMLRAHHPRAAILLDLARGRRRWEELSADEQGALGKNRRLLPLAPLLGMSTEDVLYPLLAERLLEALRRGKITARQSWRYQDLAPLIAGVHPLPGDPLLTLEGMEQLLDGTYPIDLRPLTDLTTSSPVDGGEAAMATDPVDFTEVQDEVAGLVRDHNPTWFAEHQRVAIETSGGLFRMEFSEEEFRRRFYTAIGLLGRNFRFDDAPSFRGLEHFIRRYVTEAALDLEMRFLHRTYRALTGWEERVLLTDSIGMEWRSTNPLATAHGRYHTIGVADVRGVGGGMVPVGCLPCRSGDTEAMHSVALVAKAQRVLDGSLVIYAGNGHTTTRVAAGNLMLGFGVIGAGRFQGEPRLPPPRRQEQLRKRIDLLNQVGAFLRRYPDLGSVFSARTHVVVDGVNIRQLVEDVGSLVLRLVEKVGVPLEQILPRVESSNRMKRMVRIVERGNLRSSAQSLGVCLSAGEAVLAMGAVWAGKEGCPEEGRPVSMALRKITFVKPG